MHGGGGASGQFCRVTPRLCVAPDGAGWAWAVGCEGRSVRVAVTALWALRNTRQPARGPVWRSSRTEGIWLHALRRGWSLLCLTHTPTATKRERVRPSSSQCPTRERAAAEETWRQTEARVPSVARRIQQRWFKFTHATPYTTHVALVRSCGRTYSCRGRSRERERASRRGPSTEGRIPW